jgi:hypothetical protein
MATSGFESMREGMFRYRAWVPSHGLTWDDELKPSEGLIGHFLQSKPSLLKAPWLVDPIVEFNVLQDGKIAPTFQPPGLFRRFAKLSLTRDAIGDFANKYGFLGSDPIPLHYPSGTHHAENKLKLGEPLLFWKEEIERMCLLVNLWDCVLDTERKGSAGALARHIVWNHPGETKIVRLVLKYESGGNILFLRTIVDERIEPGREMLKHWRHNDLINPARYYLNEQIDTQLEGHISPHLSTDDVYMKLDCLLAALYLSFKWEVLGKKLSMQCPQCEHFFSPTRKNQKYCNPKCTRNASWHRNKEKWQKGASKLEQK